MSKLSNAIGALRAGLVEAINASGLPPCVVGMVLVQVRTQVRLLEAQEDAETEEKKEHTSQEYAELEKFVCENYLVDKTQIQIEEVRR